MVDTSPPVVAQRIRTLLRACHRELTLAELYRLLPFTADQIDRGISLGELKRSVVPLSHPSGGMGVRSFVSL